MAKREAPEKEQTESSSVVIHEDVVQSVRQQQISFSMRETMRDTTRIGIRNALSIREMCVCDIVALLGMTQPTQLKTLSQARLAECRREGKIVYYSLKDFHIYQIIRMGLAHVAEKF